MTRLRIPRVSQTPDPEKGVVRTKWSGAHPVIRPVGNAGNALRLGGRIRVRWDAINTIPGDFCSLHRHWWPKPLRTVEHHIWPLYLGGPNTPGNRRLTCDNGHYAVHILLDELLDLDKQGKLTEEPETYLRRKRRGTRSEQALATVGFRAWVTAGRPS